MNQTVNSAKATKTIHGFPAHLGELGGSNCWAFLIQPGGKPAIITKARE
jgi:hypothetical protein